MFALGGSVAPGCVTEEDHTACICGLSAGSKSSADRVVSMLETEEERNATKMKQLHDRLVVWLASYPEGVPNEQPLRHFHIGVLLVHLNTVYDLIEGLPVSFVWKTRPKAQKDSKTPGLFSLPLLAASWGRNAVIGRADNEESEPSMDASGLADQSNLKQDGVMGVGAPPHLMLSQITIALSTDLQQLEIHHAHEVQMVSMTHITDVWQGLDGTMGHSEEFCVVMELANAKQYPLKFFERSQVKPFLAVVQALSKLMRDSLENHMAPRSAWTGSDNPQDGSVFGPFLKSGATPHDPSTLSVPMTEPPSQTQPPSSPERANMPFPCGARPLSTPRSSPRGGGYRLAPPPEASRSREEWV